ncbi:hypothetical protein ACLEDP_00340 [Lonsdalea quercina]|uniref:hypothetical protein n=1 Tax=Lonsdalea quercina TaxID=71657 RepID=UPI00397612F9
MTQAKSAKKTSRNQYTPEFCQQTLADRIGVVKAAHELGLRGLNSMPGAARLRLCALTQQPHATELPPQTSD